MNAELILPEPIPRRERTAVLERALSGDPDARGRCLLDLCRFALSVVEKAARGRWARHREDLASHAFVALCEILPRLRTRDESGRPLAWESYVGKAVFRAVRDEMRAIARQGLTADGSDPDLWDLPAPVPADDDRPREDEILLLRDAVARLSPPRRDVLARRYGLDGREPAATFREMGRGGGVSTQRVHAVHAEAVSQLRSMLSHCA